MAYHPSGAPDVTRVRTLWQLDVIPQRLPPDLLAELRRRVREGVYDSRDIVTEVARELLRHGDN